MKKTIAEIKIQLTEKNELLILDTYQHGKFKDFAKMRAMLLDMPNKDKPFLVLLSTLTRPVQKQKINQK